MQNEQAEYQIVCKRRQKYTTKSVNQVSVQTMK